MLENGAFDFWLSAETPLFQHGLPVADEQKTTLSWGRNWLGRQPRSRLGARIGNIHQGDASMTSTREERPHSPHLFGIFAGFGLGLSFLAMGFSRPTIANMRTIDLVHLIGVGVLLGVGLRSLVEYVKGRRAG